MDILEHKSAEWGAAIDRAMRELCRLRLAMQWNTPSERVALVDEEMKLEIECAMDELDAMVDASCIIGRLARTLDAEGRELLARLVDVLTTVDWATRTEFLAQGVEGIRQIRREQTGSRN